MPRFRKKTPELQTEVGVVYRTLLPSPFSEGEIRRILEKFLPNLTSDMLTLQVSKKAIVVGKLSEKKSIVSFKRKDLTNVNLVPESDCLLLTRKLKKGKQELLLIRFVDNEALKEFRRIFNYSINNDLREAELSLIQQQCIQEGAAISCEGRDVLQTHNSALRSELSGNPVNSNGQAISHKSTRDFSSRPRSEARSGTRILDSRILKDHCSSPDVYLIKHITYGQNGSKEKEYSRVTIYDIASDYSDDSSEFSAYSSSSSRD